MAALSNTAKERRRLILKWRRFLGLCVGCGAEAYGYSKCGRCMAKARERAIARREKAKKNNLCGECGKNSVLHGQYRCQSCLEKMRLRRKQRQCHSDGCFNDALFNKSYCQQCLDRIEAESHAVVIYYITCFECGTVFISPHRGRLVCGDDCNKLRLDRLRRKRRGVTLHIKTCACCGVEFETYSSRQVNCSAACSNRLRKRRERQRRRAERYGSKHIEHVDIQELFMRDRGRCQLCGRKLNLDRVVPHSLAVTIDHILPLSCGGEHSYKNTQLACFMCNSTKSNGAKPGGEQLLLF